MPNYGRAVRTGENRARAPRFNMERQIVVASKTIGSEISYQLTTSNVSKSGLLLSWHHYGAVPFLVNTILEMTIDPDSRWLDAPVACLGKVVRRFDGDEAEKEGGPMQFGIRIIQIDNSDYGIWEHCVDELEKRVITFRPGDGEAQP